LNSCISRSTLFCAFGLYFRPRLEDFFFDEVELDLLRDELAFFDVLPEDFERDVPRWEPPEEPREELRLEERLPALLLRVPREVDDEPDRLRDEVFLRAVAMNLAS
jgi:hypothetical protein